MNYRYLFLLACLTFARILSSDTAKQDKKITQKITSDPVLVANNYQLLKLTDEILQRHGIPYWAFGGTLLGAVRHKGFIPWDIDADICIFTEDFEKLLATEDEFNQFGVSLIRWNMQPKNELIRVKKGNEFGHIELEIREPDENGYLCIWGKHIFHIDELQKLVRMEFGPIEISIPEDFLPYLLRRYGENVLTEVNVFFHINPKTGKPYENFKLHSFKPPKYRVINKQIPLDATKLFNEVPYTLYTQLVTKCFRGVGRLKGRWNYLK